MAMAVDLPAAGKVIWGILREENLSRNPLKGIIDQFRKDFPTLLQKFNACRVVVYLLQNPAFNLSSTQKIAANVILLGAYGQGPGTLKSNPFAKLIHTVLSSDGAMVQPPVGIDTHPGHDEAVKSSNYISLNDLEKFLVSSFVVAEASSEIWLETIPDVIESVKNRLRSEVIPPDLDLSKLMQTNEKHGKLRSNTTAGGLGSFLLNDPEITRETEKLIQTESLPEVLKNEHYEKKSENPASLLYQNRKPWSMMCAPPLHQAANEMVWLHIDRAKSNFETDLIPLPVDYSSLISPKSDVGSLQLQKEEEKESEAHQLMQHACKEALSITQRQTLLTKLKNDPKLVNELHITPEVLPNLVENNPIVALEVLLQIIDVGIQNVDDHLTILIEMDMSVHSMEVVNRLSNSVDLPQEFLYRYISNCMKTCEGIQDKYVQNRLVRLLCVFLQSLIRHQIIDFQDLYNEILSFCVDFSRIREAAALYKLIKLVGFEDTEKLAISQALLNELELHQDLTEALSRR